MEKGKERLFEVMGRLDKTFKPKLNEGFEEIEASAEEVPAEISVDEPTGEEAPVEEKSPEEKLAELTAKVDEMHAMLHGEEASAEEVPAEEPEEIAVTTGEVDIDPENLQEWNFDKKKGEDKAEDKEDDDKEEKEEVDESEDKEEKKEKIPVAAVAKVGK